MIKLQAAIVTDVPVQILASVFGAIDELNGIYVPRNGYLSEEMLKTLIGTAEGRVERIGGQIFGACIIPYGTKPPNDKKKYKTSRMIQNHTDYGVPGAPFEPKLFEMRSPYQRFYAAEIEKLQNPETVIIEPNEWYKDGLKEKDVFGYYDAVGDLIVKQYVNYNLDGMTVIKTDGDVIIRRHAEIDVMGMKIGDRESFDRLNRGRTVEFHFAVGDQTRLAWIDLDPKLEFPWDDVKSIAAEIAGLLSQMPESLQVEIRFSGRSGFHVICVMQNQMLVNTVQSEMAKFVDKYIVDKKDERLTSQVTKESNMMRLDYSTLHQAGGLRAAWSLAYPTGLVCVPLTPRSVANFEKNQATIDVVLKSIGRIKTTAATIPEIHKYLKILLDHWWTDRTVNLATAKILAKEILPDFEDVDEIALEMASIMNLDVASIPTNELSNEIEIVKRVVDIPVNVINAIKKWWQGPPSKDEAQQIMDFRNEVGDDTRFGRYVASITNLEQIATSDLEKRLIGLEYIIRQSSAGIPISAEELESYWKKRDFDKTPEPEGSVQKNHKPIFVVQKHQAHDAGLHYDFRLASDGVLKSWVIPKLPQFLNGDQNMAKAIPVEDHPLGYAQFQGSIPSGYGAGKVVIWDKGTYETLEKSDTSWKLMMYGKNLSGAFTLFKRPNETEWSLIRGKKEARA